MPTGGIDNSHTHDDRYLTKNELVLGQADALTSAVKTTFGQQRKWFIRDGYTLSLPYADIDPNAELIVNDGGELNLFGGGGSGDVVSGGIFGGQTVHGGTGANDDLTLRGTAHATKTTSYVLLQPDGGNVGIGTSTPGALLDVYSTTGATRLSGTSNTLGQLDFYAASTGLNTNARIQADRDTSNIGGKLSFWTSAQATGTLAERLSITQAGNVGIGNAAPQYALDVTGYIGSTSDMRPYSVYHGLGERLINNTFSPTTHFSSASIPSGYAWAGAPFDGTPTTLYYNYLTDYLYTIANTAGGRVFLYKGITNAAASWQYKSVIGRFASSITTEIGVRVDDGTDNTYAELFLTGALGTSMQRLDFRYRLGGGAVTTVSTSVIFPCTEFMTLQLYCYYLAGGYYLYGYILGEDGLAHSVGAFGPNMAAAIPAAGRAGIIVKQNSGNWGRCDWFFNSFT